MSHTRYEPARQRLQRSELAVPGSNPGMFQKALEGEADYVFLDLEDAVAPGDKEQARKNVIQALLELDWRGRGKTISVRINGIDTHYMYRDVVDVVEQAGHRLDTILIPKVGVPADVYLVDALLTQIEEAKGIPHRIGIDVLIETALGMANVEAIAQSSRRLEAMHFGVADYAASCRARTVVIGGLNPDYPGDQWHAALSRMIVACRAYGLRPIDGPFGDFKDPDGYRLAARRGAALGIEGKWAIHPSQIALANEVFSPPPAEVDRAQADPGGAGRGGARRARRGAARRPHDRRRVGADGAERGQHGGGDRGRQGGALAVIRASEGAATQVGLSRRRTSPRSRQHRVGGRAWTSTNIRPRSCSPASASRSRAAGWPTARSRRSTAPPRSAASRWAVKAQIHSGARGKAGGIKLCSNEDEVRQAAKALLGKRLVTHQTGPEGRTVHRLYVEAAVPIEREIYLGFVLDRKSERVMIVASAQGGMEIEEISEKSPEAIIRSTVEPAVGLTAFQAREIAFALGLDSAQVTRAVTDAARAATAPSAISTPRWWRSIRSSPRPTASSSRSTAR